MKCFIPNMGKRRKDSGLVTSLPRIMLQDEFSRKMPLQIHFRAVGVRIYVK